MIRISKRLMRAHRLKEPGIIMITVLERNRGAKTLGDLFHFRLSGYRWIGSTYHYAEPADGSGAGRLEATTFKYARILDA